MAPPYSLQRSLTCTGPSGYMARTNTASNIQFTSTTSKYLPRSYTAPGSARAPSVSNSKVKDEKVEGLYEFLRERGLEKHYLAASSWCQVSGAAFLDEVRENADEMANVLGLSEAERAKLSGEACIAPPVQSPPSKILPRGVTLAPSINQQPQPAFVGGSLQRTCTVPVTNVETGSAAMRVEKAYIPLQAWPVQRSVAPARGYSERSASVDVRSPSMGLDMSADFPPLTHRQQKRQGDNFYRMRDWTPPRYRAGADTVHLVRSRMNRPLQFDLSAPKAAQARLSASTQGQGNIDNQPASRKLADPTTFQGVQDIFLQQHGAEIRKELPGVKLIPTQVGHQVSQNFMHSIANSNIEILPAYHGTNAANIPSIQQSGLRVPGNGGVTVAHGSAHGVGIYTAVLGNSWLSKGFCDSDEMLVCGVAEKPAQSDKGTAYGMPSATAVPTATAQSGPRYHRTSTKYAGPGTSAAPNTTLGNFAVHRESREVRHVGGAMVVFDESRVAPLFVAQGIGRGTSGTTGAPATTLWPTGGTPNDHTAACQNGGVWAGRDQVIIGEEHFWIPPEDSREPNDIDKAKDLHHRWTAKARGCDRGARRDAKMAGESQREWAWQ